MWENISIHCYFKIYILSTFMPTWKSVRLWVYVVIFPITILQRIDIILWQSFWKRDKKQCSISEIWIQKKPAEIERNNQFLSPYLFFYLTPTGGRETKVILWTQRVSERKNKKLWEMVGKNLVTHLLLEFFKHRLEIQVKILIWHKFRGSGMSCNQ